MSWDIFDVVLFFWCFHQKMDKKYILIRYISLNIYVHKIKLNLDLTQNELLDNFVGYEFPGNICAFYIMLANCRFTLEGKQFRLGHYWTVMVIIEMIWYPAWTTNGEKICCNIHSRFALLLRILQSFNLGNKNVHYVFTWAHIKLFFGPNVSEKPNTILIHCLILLILYKKEKYNDFWSV